MGGPPGVTWGECLGERRLGEMDCQLDGKRSEVSDSREKALGRTLACLPLWGELSPRCQCGVGPVELGDTACMVCLPRLVVAL
jgi:hypothetical protein